METIIASIIIVMIMLWFTVYIFKNLIKRINQSSKKWFLDKLQEYDYLVDEREAELEKLKRQIEEEQRKLRMIKEIKQEPENIFSVEVEEKLEKMKQFKNMPAQVPRRPEVIYDIPTPQYKEASFFNSYKELKKKFDLNADRIVKEFIKEHKRKDDGREYKVLAKFRKKFTDKILYESSTLKNEDQYKLVKSILTKEEREYITINEEEKTEFSVRKLIEQIEDTMKTADPLIYVYVSKNGKNYDKLDSRVRTKVYNNMAEGVIIQYKGKMYDYSI